MSEKSGPRYVGPSQTGVDLTIPVGNQGEYRDRQIPHGGTVPTEIGGQKVPVEFLDSLLEQPDNWTMTPEAKADDAKSKTSGKTGEKE